MIANLIKVFEYQEQAVFAAYSNETLVDLAYIRTQADAIKFGAKHVGVVAIRHAPAGAALPILPPPEAFPGRLPRAVFYPSPAEVTPWPKGFPEKIVIGGMGTQFANGLGVVQTILGLGFNAIVILRDGSIHQIGKITERGRTFIGSDVLNIVPECAGPLVKVGERFVNYFSGDEIPREDVRIREGRYYHQYTFEQELALVEMCTWLCRVSRGNLKPDDILPLSSLTAVDSPGPSMKDSIEDFRITIAAKLGV